MAKTPKLVAEGQLPAAKGTLYTVPGSTSLYLSKINITNTSTIHQTVEVWIKRGTSRLLFHVEGLEQYETITYEGGLTLEAADLIEGNTITVSVVDYIITGVIET